MDTSQMVGIVILIAFAAVFMAAIGFISAFPMNFVGMRLSYNLRIRYWHKNIFLSSTQCRSQILVNLTTNRADI